MFFLLTVLLFVFSTAGCQNSKSEEQKESATLNPKSIDKGDYTILKRVRILDKVAFPESVEVFSYLIPEDWEYDGEIIWRMPGEHCQGNNNWFETHSKDNKYSLKVYPVYNWGITDTQQVNYFMQQAADQYCGFGNPMTAEQYLKEEFIPELGNPELVKIEKEEINPEVLEVRRKGDLEMRNYGMQVTTEMESIKVNLRWEDGTEGETLITLSNSKNVNVHPYLGVQNTNYSSMVQRVLVRYPGETKEKSDKLMRTIMTSIRTNDMYYKTVADFWVQVRQQSHMAHLDKLKMMNDYNRRMQQDFQNKQFEDRMAGMDANMRSWEARQASQDKAHSNFVKTIRGVETFTDNTGTFEMNSGYNYAWSRNDGSSFIISDNPNFDPSSVLQDQEWQLMKKEE